MKKILKGVAVLSLGAIFAGCSCNKEENMDPIINNDAGENESIIDVSTDTAKLYQECVQSVVKVIGTEDFGSGVVFKEEGNTAYILTNAHVLTDKYGANHYSSIDIIFSNYIKIKGTFIYLDRNEDVAVIAIPKSDNYKVAKFIENDSDVKVGQSVYAIGNPWGVDFSMTEGIISSNRLNVQTQYISNTPLTTTYVYNSTATINGGNSGGPLFNSKGEVIAINTMTPTGEDIRNFNYSIPINHFIKVADYLVINRSEYVKPSLKLEVKSIVDFKIEELTTFGITVRRGVYVLGSSETDLSTGRIITHVNGVEVNTVSDYEFELMKYSKNETITITSTDKVGINIRTANLVVR